MSRICVITPCYNGAHFLEGFLDAIQRQIADNALFNLLIVDNGSTDQSWQIIQKAAQTQPNIRGLQYTASQSSYAARNAGIKACTADWLVFTDCDCRPDETWMQAILEATRDLAPCILAGSIEIYPQTRKWTVTEWYDAAAKLNQEAYSQRNVGATANLIVHRSILERVNGFKEVTSGGDHQFCREARQVGFPVRYCAQIRVRHPARLGIQELWRKEWRTGKGTAFQLHAGAHTKHMFMGVVCKTILALFLQPQQWRLWRRTLQKFGIRSHISWLFPACAFTTGAIGRVSVLYHLLRPGATGPARMSHPTGSRLTHPRKTVCHMSSVHAPLDPRIFFKECVSLAKHGYNVIWMVPCTEHQERSGVTIHAVPLPRNRMCRMLFTPCRLFLRAWHIQADVYHFHDPELIPFGLLLRLCQKQVIYDIHEDYQTSIRRKPYITKSIARMLSGAFGFLERRAARCFHLILAERYYLQRFPQGTPICNYPVFTPIQRIKPKKAPTRLLYTGNITLDRGALHHAKLARELQVIPITMIGRCNRNVAQQIRSITDESIMEIQGIETYVPFDSILAYYRMNHWIAGIAIFPDHDHYRNKELTKLFEYMAAGIPIICSNFPVWQALVQENGVGLCVDPESLNEQVEAVRYLTRHPEKAVEMGNRGRVLAEQKFNWREEEKKLLTLYQRVLKE